MSREIIRLSLYIDVQWHYEIKNFPWKKFVWLRVEVTCSAMKKAVYE